ncbi:MAG: YiiX/YebB-like N1pC/P60 family cysteine hydrolase, partial [Psychromonas sp.]
DVLLVEGDSRFSTAIKYLSQSTWSHAALVISDIQNLAAAQMDEAKLLEADVLEGVRVLPLSEYWGAHTRICRPIGLTAEEIDTVVDAAMSRIGHQYDLKNIFDLARYLIQTPPAPAHWRRRMLALGSGDPTRAICSSLIAEAFQSIRYPILPESIVAKSQDPSCMDCYEEFLSIRHSSLFAPRDFDISPYFQIIKPTLDDDFDHRNLNWSENEPPAE